MTYPFNVRPSSSLFHEDTTLKQNYNLSNKDVLKIAGLTFGAIILPRAIADACLPNKKISSTVSYLSSAGLTLASWVLLAGGSYLFISKDKQSNALKLFRNFPESFNRWGKVTTKIAFFASVTLGFYLPSRQHFILADSINAWARGKIPIKLHSQILQFTAASLITPLIAALTTRYLCEPIRFPKDEIENIKREDESLQKSFCELHKKVQQSEWIAEGEEKRLRKKCENLLKDPAFVPIKEKHLAPLLNEGEEGFKFHIDILLLFIQHQDFFSTTPPPKDAPGLLASKPKEYLQNCQKAYDAIKADYTSKKSTDSEVKNFAEILFPDYEPLDPHQNPFQKLRHCESLNALEPWSFLEDSINKEQLSNELKPLEKYDLSPLETLQLFIKHEAFFLDSNTSAIPDELRQEEEVGDTRIQEYKKVFNEVKNILCIDTSKSLGEYTTKDTTPLKDQLQREMLNIDWKIFSTLFQNLSYLLNEAPTLLKEGTDSKEDEKKNAMKVLKVFQVYDDKNKLDPSLTRKKLKLYHQFAAALDSTEDLRSLITRADQLKKAKVYLNSKGINDPFLAFIQGI